MERRPRNTNCYDIGCEDVDDFYIDKTEQIDAANPFEDSDQDIIEELRRQHELGY